MHYGGGRGKGRRKRRKRPGMNKKKRATVHGTKGDTGTGEGADAVHNALGVRNRNPDSRQKSKRRILRYWTGGLGQRKKVCRQTQAPKDENQRIIC